QKFEHYISGIYGRFALRDLYLLEISSKIGTAQQKEERRARFFRLFDRLNGHLMFRRNIEIDLLAVGQEKFLLGTAILPTHLAGTLDDESSLFAQLATGTVAIDLSEIGCKSLHLSITRLQAVDQFADIDIRRAGDNAPRRQHKRKRKKNV